MYKLSPANEAVYTDIQQDGKSFYGEVETRYKTSAISVLRTLDPPDPDTDAACVKHFEEQVTDRIKHPIESPVQRKAIREWAEGRTTLERHIVKALGSNSLVYVKDFFATDTGLRSLFPAYIESRIQQGLLQQSLVNELVFADEVADSTVVIGAYVSTPAGERRLSKIGEGALLPVSKITAADSQISLNKYGRTLEWSYESVNNQRIDVIGNHITTIGQQIGVDETDDLLDLAIIGDGTTMGAAETNANDTDVAVAGTIAFSDMLTWYYSVAAPAYQLDKAVGGTTDMRLIADLVEFSDVEYLMNQSSLRIPTPAAMTYFPWAGSVTDSHYLDRMVIGIDSRRAFVAYTYGGFISEAGKIIDRQINQRTFSYWRGFRKFDAGAVAVLDVNTVL